MPKKIIPIAKPWFSSQEAQAAYNVVKSGWLIAGPAVEKLEKEFAKKSKVKYAIAVNSGSSALLVAQQALGISVGDEVIVPTMTFVSTASSCMYLGAKPVFTDINLSTYCMDINDIEKKITKRTKAIIPVHYAGQSADLDSILKIAKKHNLRVVEDAAEAHLTKYKGRIVGGIGDIGIFSFTPSKVMTTGEGGMIVTNNKKLAEECRLIRDFYDIKKFKYSALGFNFRMPDIMGAIGLVQLTKLEKIVKIRQKNAIKYTKELGKIDGIIIPFIEKIKWMNFQLYTIRLDLDKLTINRDEFIASLLKKGINSRLYYPCLHNQELFKGINKYKDNQFPNAIAFSKTALALPIYPEL
ncbi:MAG: DegT/DnrJ/EryC1/StrS family aminotransferase, partial [Candidatus Falkowbacteria bacterium]